MQKKISNKKAKTIQNKKTKVIPKNTGTEKILLISFIALLVLVIILTIVAVNKKKEYDKKQSTDIIMPIIEKGVNNTFNIDISNLKEKGLKSYSFKITNYKDKKTNSKQIEYKLSINTLENDVELKLYKNKDDKNLLTNSEKYEITAKLPKDKKQEDVYTIIIKANKATGKNKTIEVKVAS